MQLGSFELLDVGGADSWVWLAVERETGGRTVVLDHVDAEDFAVRLLDALVSELMEGQTFYVRLRRLRMRRPLSVSSEGRRCERDSGN
jgi:hypothetical protein